MKKFFLFTALAVAIGMTSCSDDECDHVVNPDPVVTDTWIEGMWYDEVYNEEVNYDGSGTYYDRYSNVVLSGETVGRYEMDYANMKLTYRYSYIGQNLTDDWTVKDHKEFSFKLSSATASGLNLEKIVEKHKLNVGETVKLSFSSERPDLNVSSYSSKNELIASVASDGTVTPMGGKGTTYIKITTNVGNVWAKITIGDDNKDLWCDYVRLIGADFNTMKQFFSSLGEPVTQGNELFGYAMSIHQYIESIVLQIDTDKNAIIAVRLTIREGIPPIEIESYLKSRLYEQDGVEFYTTQPVTEVSKAIVTYDKENRCVTFYETQSTIHPELWHDFTKLFGSNQESVKNAMEQYGYSFLLSEYNYSTDGSDYYSVKDNSYLNTIGFVYNPDKQVSEFWLYPYLDSESNLNGIYSYLGYKYIEDESESTESSLIFYNEDKSLRVKLDLINGAIVYTNLAMKQHEANILGNYYEGLGLTHDQIIERFGSPYSDDGDYILYAIATDYANLAVFSMNAETGKCRAVAVTVNESISTSTIVDYLNSKYTVFANGTAEDGSQYAWTNGPSVAESTFGIIYYPEDRQINYVPLGSAASAPAKAMSLSTFKIDDSFVKQAQTMHSALLNSAKKTKAEIKSNKSALSIKF